MQTLGVCVCVCLKLIFAIVLADAVDISRDKRSTEPKGVKRGE